MNKLILSLLTFVIVPSLFATTTYICGHFDEPKATSVTIQYYASTINNIEDRSTKQELNLDSENNFRFELELTHPISFHLLNGENYLFYNKYIAPGDSICFRFKENEISMDGRCEECFAFMFELENKFPGNTIVKSGSTEVKEFTDFWNKRRMDQVAFLNEYFHGKSIPKMFKEYMLAEINYRYGIAHLQYSMFNKNARAVLNDPAYRTFLDSIPVNNQAAIISGTYLFFLRELPYNLYMTMFRNNTLGYAVGKYIGENRIHLKDSIAKKYFTGDNYKFALYRILTDEIKAVERRKGRPEFDSILQSADSLFSLYSSSFKEPSYYKRLINKLHDLDSSDKPAPDFTVKDVFGKNVKLSDFKGSVVYLDFWATTCPPCIAEIPKAKLLQEKYKDKNVVFLYISMDHSPDKLKKFILSNSLTGIHLNDPKGFASVVAELYEIHSMPHYIIVDKNGFIFNNDAPRPSLHPEELFEKALR